MAAIGFALDCPHCSTAKAIHGVIDARGLTRGTHRDIWFCDAEMGGCDKPVVVEYRVIVKARICLIGEPGDEQTIT